LTDQIQSLADRMTSAQAAGERFEPVPEVAGDLDLAYAVQDRTHARLIAGHGDIAGWKVGLTTPRMQQLCGVAQPIAGAIFASRIHASPATVRAADFVRLGLEFELSFRVAATPPAGEELTASSVRRYLDAAAASYELIDDRAADYARLDAPSMVADISWNRGLVLSTPRPLSELPVLTGIGCVLEQDGQEIDRGQTDDVGGDPLAIVAWLANSLDRRGHALQPGQWIMTGSMVPTRFGKAGETWRFTLDGFEPVVVEVV
jgi:2-keto-4-pentenoate hydratase